MITHFPALLNDIGEAKEWLIELYRNSELINPDDDVNDIVWDCEEPTEAEKSAYQSCMDRACELFDFSGEDIHLFCLRLDDPEYMIEE